MNKIRRFFSERFLTRKGWERTDYPHPRGQPGYEYSVWDHPNFRGVWTLAAALDNQRKLDAGEPCNHLILLGSPGRRMAYFNMRLRDALARYRFSFGEPPPSDTIWEQQFGREFKIPLDWKI